MEAKSGIIDLELSSELRSIHELEPRLLNLKKLLNIPGEKFYNLMISITEALTNAIIHGNKMDAAKKIKFQLTYSENEISVCIEDEGAGFNPETLADPRAPENLYKENGRGVFLIRSLMDEAIFNFSGHGTRLVMKFHI